MSAELSGDRTVPSIHRAAPTSPVNHFVEFYDDHTALAQSVARFISLGLSEDGAAVVIAQPEHRASIEGVLGRSVDLDAARELGRYVSLDAEETLSLFMVDGAPDAALFEGALGKVVEDLPTGSNLRFFGEMVAVLWAEGNVAGALALEDLWNSFLEKYPARLFCAYPSSVMVDGERKHVDGVRACHSHILVPNSHGF